MMNELFHTTPLPQVTGLVAVYM